MSFSSFFFMPFQLADFFPPVSTQARFLAASSNVAWLGWSEESPVSLTPSPHTSSNGPQIQAALPPPEGGVGGECRNLSGSFKPPLPQKRAAQALAVHYTILQRHNQWAPSSILDSGLHPRHPRPTAARQPTNGQVPQLRARPRLRDTTNELRLCFPSLYLQSSSRLDFQKRKKKKRNSPNQKELTVRPLLYLE